MKPNSVRLYTSNSRCMSSICTVVDYAQLWHCEAELEWFRGLLWSLVFLVNVTTGKQAAAAGVGGGVLPARFV
jgi:hypothetical protein